jgi:hypothetical protein
VADEGTSFTIDLPVTGKDKIDAASASIEVLAARLDAASKAVQAGEASYREAEALADRTAKAVERLALAAEDQKIKLQQAQRAGDEKSIQRVSNALELLAAKQGRAADQAARAKTALATETTALDKLKAELDKSQKAHKAAEEAAKSTEPAYATIGRGLRKLGGPLADIGDKVTTFGEGFSKLRKGLGTAGAWLGIATAITAVAAAIVGTGVAFATSTAKILAWGVGLASARGHMERLAQAMLWGSKTGGAALNDQINNLSRQLPLTTEEIAEQARGLAYMGLRGKALNDALSRTATLAARLKFGPDFADEMLTLDEQSKVFHANLAQLFGGLKVEGLLRGLQKIGALLDKDTASGKAIKTVFESVFQPIADWLTKSQTKIEAFFLRLEILALKAAIQFKLHFSTIAAVVKVFAVGALVVFGLIAAAILTVVTVLGAMAAAVLYVASLAVDFVKVGAQMIAGLVEGIKNAAPAVLAAIRGVVTDAITAAKKLLGIASPSRVFADIGLMVGAGMEVGVASSTPDVQSAVAGMTAPPTAGSAAPAPAPAVQASKSSGHNLSGTTFIFNGVKDAADAIQQFREALIDVLDGGAAQVATSPAGGGPSA